MSVPTFLQVYIGLLGLGEWLDGQKKETQFSCQRAVLVIYSHLCLQIGYQLRHHLGRVFFDEGITKVNRHHSFLEIPAKLRINFTNRSFLAETK